MVTQKEWTSARKKLKSAFMKAGIVRCEICHTDAFLSFAHSKKRRFIHTNEELFDVALLCIPCHEKIEYSGHAEMYAKIQEIKSKRIAEIRIKD